MHVYVLQFGKVFVIPVSFEKMKSDYNQITRVKDVIGVHSYGNEVNSHIQRSKVILGRVKWKILVFVIWVTFKKSKSDWHQTWVKDIVMQFLCLSMRSKVMYQDQGSSEVNLGGKCKIGIFF